MIKLTKEQILLLHTQLTEITYRQRQLDFVMAWLKIMQ